MKLKRKLLIMIMINILLLQNLINYQQNIFAARLAQPNLTSKNDIAGLVKQTNFEKKLKNVNKKVTSTKPKNLLVKNEFKKNTTVLVLLLVKVTLILIEHNFT